MTGSVGAEEGNEDEVLEDVDGSEMTKKVLGVHEFDCFGERGWKGGSFEGEDDVELSGCERTEG
jgi:hypothetical protein